MILPLLASLALIIAAAKFGGWLSGRLRQPVVLGELLIGLLLGPSVLGLFNLPYFESAHVGEAIREFGELGVIFLMFTAGLEVAVDDLRKAGRPAVWTGVLGVLAPLVLGALALLPFGLDAQHAIFLGIVIASAGLLAAGFTMSGAACLAGIALFAIGEMLSSPKMNEYLGVIAPEGKKGLYMGYANMPTAIGWAYGSFMAGDLYGKMGEKAGLALRYLQEHGGVPAGVDRTNAMEAMQRTFGMDASTATTTLWNTYHPYQLWYPFVAVGLASAVGTWLYAMWVKKAEGDI